MAMNRRSAIVVSALVGGLAACGGAQGAREPDTVQMKDQVVEEIEQEQARAQLREPAAPHHQADQEELAVEMFDIAPDRPARAEGGLVIHQRSAGPDWSFEFDHHGRTDVITYRGTPLYAEGIAYGHLYVLSQLGDAVQVTLRSDVPDRALTPDAALTLARRERQSRLGCEGEREESDVLDNGTVMLRVLDPSGTESCRIIVGRYTAEVVDL